MALLYFILALSLLCVAYFSWMTARKGSLLSPHMIAFAAPVVALLIPIVRIDARHLYETGFLLPILAGILGTLLAAVLFEIPNISDRDQPRVIYRLHTSVQRIAFALSVGAIGFVIFKEVGDQGGIGQMFERSRVASYQRGGILAGKSYLQLVLTFALFFYYLQIAKFQRSGHYVLALTLVAALSGFYLITANTRFPIIAPVIAYAIVALRNGRRSGRLFKMGFLAAFALITLFLFAPVGNALRAGWVHRLKGVSAHDLVEMASDQTRRDLYYPLFMYDLVREVRHSSEIEYGKAWVYYGIISVVPRRIWPDKPITSTANRMTERVYRQRVGEGVDITTFTIFGEGFLQGRELGSFLAGYLFMFLYVVQIRILRTWDNTQYWIAMLLMQMITFWRDQLPIPHVITNMIVISIVWIFSARVEQVVPEEEAGLKHPASCDTCFLERGISGHVVVH